MVPAIHHGASSQHELKGLAAALSVPLLLHLPLLCCTLLLVHVYFTCTSTSVSDSLDQLLHISTLIASLGCSSMSACMHLASVTSLMYFHILYQVKLSVALACVVVAVAGLRM